MAYSWNLREIQKIKLMGPKSSVQLKLPLLDQRMYIQLACQKSRLQNLKELLRVKILKTFQEIHNSNLLSNRQ